jgi:alpha,alpha-trehalase
MRNRSPRDAHLIVEVSPQEFDAVIFDMDGVVTRTATLHAAAWKQLFDSFLRARAGPRGAFVPFGIEEDYRTYVDGKPRYDGVASFLASRRISLPYGSPSDPSGAQTVCGLGNRKDAIFRQELTKRGAEVFESTVLLIRHLKSAGIKTGIFSASRNAEAVLSAAKILGIFDARVDGVDADRLKLPGKPDPATLLELARRLGVTPARTVVVEDAIAGVEAGRAGHFGMVIGVNRSKEPGTLAGNGADVEVADLSQVGLKGENGKRRECA